MVSILSHWARVRLKLNYISSTARTFQEHVAWYKLHPWLSRCHQIIKCSDEVRTNQVLEVTQTWIFQVILQIFLDGLPWIKNTVHCLFMWKKNTENAIEKQCPYVHIPMNQLDQSTLHLYRVWIARKRERERKGAENKGKEGRKDSGEE